MVVDKKHQLFGRQTDSPNRPAMGRQLQQDIDTFFLIKARQVAARKQRRRSKGAEDRLERESKLVSCNLDAKEIDKLMAFKRMYKKPGMMAVA